MIQNDQFDQPIKQGTIGLCSRFVVTMMSYDVLFLLNKEAVYVYVPMFLVCVAGRAAELHVPRLPRLHGRLHRLHVLLRAGDEEQDV